MLPRLAHANHHDLRERRVAAGARSTRFFTDVASRALQFSVHPNPRPQQSACPRKERSSGGRGCDLTRAKRRSLGKLSKWRCDASETGARGAQDQRRSARNRTAAAPRKSVQLHEVWRRHHGAAAIDPAGRAVLQIRLSPLPRSPLRVTTPEIPRASIL